MTIKFWLEGDQPEEDGPTFQQRIYDDTDERITAHSGAADPHEDRAFATSAVAAEAAARVIDVDAEETARIAADLLKAPLASPTFTGTPTGPTPTLGDDSTNLATTAFVQAARPLRRLARDVLTGSGTWNEPAGAVKVIVKGIGAGGGGGAGGTQPAGAAVCGGGGGAPGSCFEVEYDAADLPSSMPYAVGAGGTAGAAVSTNGATGGTGGTGGNTSFGTFGTPPFIRAEGGNGGGGGSATTGSGGTSNPAGSVGQITAGNGNSAGAAGGTSPWVGLMTPLMAGGGGGGGGITSANVSTAGGAGRGNFCGTGSVSQAGGTTNGGNGTTRSSPLTIAGHGYRLNPSYPGGGGGGGNPAGGNGGTGGTGIGPGSGGGGGGAARDGSTSGAGGAGADGLLIVETWG